MKFRIIASALVVAVLLALAALSSNGHPVPPAAAPAPSADDASLKSLRIE